MPIDALSVLCAQQLTRDLLKIAKFLLDLFWKLPQFHTSNFRKVVWQHTGGMVEIYLAFQRWKNFENSLRIDKVIAMSLVYYFLWDTVYYVEMNKHIFNFFTVR